MDINQQEKLHASQGTFISYNQTESAKKIKERNIMVDEPCWSDSDKLNNLKNNFNKKNSINAIQQYYQDIQDQSNRNLQNQLKEERIKKSIQASKIQSLIKQLGRRSDIQKSNLNNSRSQALSIDESSFRHDILQNSFNSVKYQQNLDDESSFNKGYQMKKLTVSNFNGQYQAFKEKISQLAKIKLRIQYFYNNFTNIYRNRQLNNKIRYHINDLSDIIPTKTNNIIKQICQRSSKNRNLIKLLNFPLLDPQSKIGFTIKFLLAFLNLIYFFFFSLFAIFSVKDSIIQEITLQLITIIWIIEIILNFNYKIYLFSAVISVRTQIAFIYLRQKAIFDLIPLILALIPYQEQTISYYWFLQLIKFHNLAHDIIEIQQQLCMRVKNYYLVQLFNLVLKLFLIAHIISCLWYLLGLIEQNYLGEQNTWFQDSIGQDGTWWKLYLSSLYWSLSLMTTGSNTSTTVLQTLFTTFIMLFTSITFAYILNVIGLILSEMDQGLENKRRDINIINEYMRKRHISSNLQARVNLNLDYYYQKNFKQEQMQNSQILDKISVDLKKSLLIEYNKQILNKIDLITNNFSQEVIEELSLHLNEEYYFPNQIISLEKVDNDFSLMYIIEGDVELYHKINKQQHQNPIEKYKQGDIFGQFGFFTGLSKEVSLKSKEFTKVMKINRNNFLEVIKKNEKEFQQFCEIKDKLLMYSQYQIVRLNCSICCKNNHLFEKCPNININKQALIYKLSILEKETQQRKSYIRKQQCSINSLIIQKCVYQIARKYIQSIQSDVFIKDQMNLNNDSSSEETHNTTQEDEQQYLNEDFSISQDRHRQLVEDILYVHEPEPPFRNTSHNSLINQKPEHFKQKSKNISDFNEEEMLQLLETKIQQINEQYHFEKTLSQNHETLNSKIISIQEIQIPRLSNKEMEKQKREKSDSSIQKGSSENNPIEEKNEKSQNCNQFNSLNSKDKRRASRKNHSKLEIINEQTQFDFSKQQIANDKSKINIKQIIEILLDSYKNQQKDRSTVSQKTYWNPDYQQNLDQYNILNPFMFDSLKDYQFYFPYGNSKILLPKYQRIKVKKMKKTIKTMRQDTYYKKQLTTHTIQN